MKLDEKTAAVASDWWADRFQIDAKRAQFRAELYSRLIEGTHAPDDERGFGLSLRVDYDPEDTLLDVVRAIGIDCRGFMFSADGILPNKTRMRVYRDGRIEAGNRWGYSWLVGGPVWPDL
jgi:hypothetical protein